MKASNQKFAISMIGPPGSGKGTQAELLAAKLKLHPFETSFVLEESWANAKEEDYIEVNNEKFYLLNEKKLFDEGVLCSPPFVAFIVEKKIKELAGQNKNILFSGSPRTIYDGKKIMPLLIDLYGINNILILKLKVSDKESIWRNTRRRLCSKCRYPVPFTEETQKLKECLECGGKLVTRTLDKEDVIKIRLKQYEERTHPLFKYFKEIGIIIKEINGEQSIENVHKDILKAVVK